MSWQIIDYTSVFFLLLLVSLSCFEKKRSLSDNTDRGIVVISKDVTYYLKGVCCVLIVIHHYGLRCQHDFNQSIIGVLGQAALFSFMLLSGYGIVKSEIKAPTTITQFVVKRFQKLLIPLWIVNILTIWIYYNIGPSNDLSGALSARVNENFLAIGSHKVAWFDYLLMIIGVKSIDAATWFVEVILLSYLAFLIAKTLFPIKKRFAFVSFYIIIMLFFTFCYKHSTEWVGLFFRHLWVLIMGVVLAVYEDKLIKINNWKRRIFVAVNLFLLTSFFLHRISLEYVATINLIMIVISVLNRILDFLKFNHQSFLFTLSSISYFMYIIHIKVLTIEWYYWGYQSLLIPLMACIIISYILFCLYTRLRWK